ncbi:MAG: hypothetical protein AAFV88_25205, partial [Planctomycetota bacterium]
PVVSDRSLERAAAYAAYRARLADRRDFARIARRQRNLQRLQNVPKAGYTFPRPSAYTYLTTNSLGFVTGADLRSKISR